MGSKQLIEKSREYHNHRQQSIPDTKRKRKRTETDACKINEQMYKHIDQLSSKSVMITMLNRTERKNKKKTKTTTTKKKKQHENEEQGMTAKKKKKKKKKKKNAL